MYRIHVRDHFDAAHYLRGYQGRCEALHGHRWEVVVALETARLNEIDLGYDFTELKRVLEEQVLARLDHRCLNDVPPFDQINASTENLARVIYGWLAEGLGAVLGPPRDAVPSRVQSEAAGPSKDEAPVRLAYVEVYESPDSWVRYTPGGEP